MTIFDVFNVAGGLALFLYGMSIMGIGLEKALAAAHPNAVYLLHPMATNSAMLGELIDGLRAAGYTLAAL